MRLLNFFFTLFFVAISFADAPVIWQGDDAYFLNVGSVIVPGLPSYLLSSDVDGKFVSTTVNSPLNFGSNILSCNVASGSQAGCLSSVDWTTFNNKADESRFNYITNPFAEVDTSGWNLYNDTGRTTAASVVKQDITFTSALSGSGGNGATITYNFCGVSYVGPVVTCPSGTAVQVCWYNGPTLAQNPTATVLKAAYDAVPCAVAIATSAITGTAGNRQYEDGVSTLVGGGDASPVDGTGGAVTGVTFTRTLVSPLVGIASFDLGKDAANRQGMGVSTDFVVSNLDQGAPIQISFAYKGSTNMTLGTGSDVQVFIYDITNATMIPVTPLRTIKGPVNTIKTFVGLFTASMTSVNYRLIFHIATTNALSWDLILDSVTVTDIISPSAATQVPSVVLQAQPISGAVTDHMAVMWTDGATQWVPATIAGATIPVFGTDITQLGFATNIIGATADVYIGGAMDGFSFGPFLGYDQYLDNTAGGISALPSPFTSLYVPVGKAISSTVLNIQFNPHVNNISNSSGVPLKGGLLTSNGANDGTGDSVLTVGANGAYLLANSAAANGISWTAPVGTAPIVYTAATHAFSCTTATNSVAGCMSAADHTGLHNAVTLSAIGATPNANGASLSTQVLNLQPASASFGGVVTTGAQTFAGVKTLPSPVFTTQTTMPAINLFNGATNGTNTVIVFKDGHIKATQTTAATATVSANAGTGATCTLTTGTDPAGIINLTTTATAPAAGAQCTVNFNKSYGAAPKCVTTATSTNSAVLLVTSGIYFTTTTTTLVVNFTNADLIGHTYNWSYICIE